MPDDDATKIPPTANECLGEAAAILRQANATNSVEFVSIARAWSDLAHSIHHVRSR